MAALKFDLVNGQNSKIANRMISKDGEYVDFSKKCNCDGQVRAHIHTHIHNIHTHTHTYTQSQSKKANRMISKEGDYVHFSKKCNCDGQVHRQCNIIIYVSRQLSVREAEKKFVAVIKTTVTKS